MSCLGGRETTNSVTLLALRKRLDYSIETKIIYIYKYIYTYVKFLSYVYESCCLLNKHPEQQKVHNDAVSVSVSRKLKRQYNLKMFML